MTSPPYTPNSSPDVIRHIETTTHELYPCHQHLLNLIARGFDAESYSVRSLSVPPTYKQLAYAAFLVNLSDAERTLLYDISRLYGLSQAHVSYMIDTLKK